MSPFIEREKLNDIFGDDLYNKEGLLKIFIELCGFGDIKPFECVGTFSEVRYCVSKLIKEETCELPYLLKYYKDNFELENTDEKRLHEYNNDNNLPEEFSKILYENIK